MRVSNWDRLGLAVALLAVVLSGAVALRIFEGIPHLEDEFALLWQAEVMADGELYLSSPPAPGSFIVPFVVDHEGRRFGKYPPGWPAALALGVFAGAHWLVNPILAGLGVWLIYRLAGRLLPPPLALLAATLAALSPWLLMLSGSLMSHGLSLVLAAAFALTWFDLFVDPEARASEVPPGLPVALAGGCAGLLVLTRPLTGVGVLLPFALHGLWMFVRRPTCRRRLMGIALGGGLVVALLPLWQYALTGDPWRNPYTLWWSYDRLGFGPGVGPVDGGHSLKLAYVNTRHSLRVGLHDLFGWPYLSWIFLPFGWWALRRRLGAGLLYAVLPSLILVYIAYWIGAWVLGPRYYYESLPGLAIASAAGIGWLGGWLDESARARNQRRLATVAVVALLLATNVLFYWPARLGGLHGLYGIAAAPLRSIRSADIEPALLFVDADHWTEYGNLLPLAPPYSERELRVVWSQGGASDTRVQVAFPDYQSFYYEPDQPGVLFRFPPPTWGR
ncbi:MAG: hypothetical protein R3191_00420 [Anaerolineales bacterium]|nr:hypothetical protein [Anaerolineales bacterium]